MGLGTSLNRFSCSHGEVYSGGVTHVRQPQPTHHRLVQSLLPQPVLPQASTAATVQAVWQPPGQHAGVSLWKLRGNGHGGVLRRVNVPVLLPDGEEEEEAVCP